MCRTIEDCAMVFNVIHGVDEKDPSTVTTPFHFDRNIDLASVRIGVDAKAPKEFVDKLRELGATPRTIEERPRVEGAGSPSGESAAAWDFYVRMLAEELGIDMNALPAPEQRAPNSDPGNPSKMQSLARRASQRSVTALDFLQGQRRRHILMLRMAEFMKDLDMYVQPETGGGDIGIHAQTGHPCAVVPYKFESPTGPVPGAVDWRPDRDPTPIKDYKPKPICAVVAGGLFNDDMILSVAHKFQVNTDWHLKHPAL
jgi:Asp-tRNA(Asn)/Glu-tRNA(Gln) amidotransferase A subunit family amidase